MNIVFFSHPGFLGSQSMPRFTKMLAEGMKERGHKIECWTPKPRLYNLSVQASFKKWLGYLDQYVIFPFEVRYRLKKYQANTLFVFTDQALGPWVPLVADRAHVIHCHDFLAQRSALGEISENPTGWSGRKYQSFIRRGYSKGKYFISVSQKTKDDLQQFLPSPPSQSEVVYNGLNLLFTPKDPAEVRNLLGKKTGIDLTSGYLLHVGGNQWYKNRSGVIEIYNAWRSAGGIKLPLLMIGKAPDSKLRKEYEQSPYKSEIYLLSGWDDEFVCLAYSEASVFLFPSLAEGFGWPIAEAMASGCPVITTAEAPMTEVAGEAAFLIPRKPPSPIESKKWASKSAKVLDKVVRLSVTEREKVVREGLTNAKRFGSELALNKIEAIYQRILVTSQK